MRKSAYVFILKFGSKVHVSEVHAESASDAMSVWGDRLKVESIISMDDRVKQDFLEDIQDEYGVALKGIVNIWMFVVALHRLHGHVYFVKTVSTALCVDADGEIYSFIVNFEGGEYVSQVRAKSVHGAALEWGRNLNVNDMENFNDKDKAALLRKIRKIYPNALAGAAGAWSFTAAPLGRFFLVNIVKTSEEPEEDV